MKLLAVILSTLMLVACGGGGSGGGESGTTSTASNSIVTVQGKLTVTAGEDATKYTVFNSNQSLKPTSTGSFAIAVAKNIPTYTYAISDNGKKVYASVNESADGSVTIDAQSTAEALVLLNPLLIPSTSVERAKLTNIAKTDAAVGALAGLIGKVYGSVPEPLNDPRISDALANAVKSALVSWQTANVASASALRQVLPTHFAVVRRNSTSGSSRLEILNNDMGALTMANSAGSNLRLELTQGNLGVATNVDWVVRIVELDPTKIQWAKLYPTFIDIDSSIKSGGYDQRTVVEGAVASGFLKFVVDPIGYATDQLGAKIFPDNGITLPHDGVYAVVALSGSPFGDNAEFDSIQRSDWQRNQSADAATLNIGESAIDLIGVGTGFLDAATGVNIDISPALALALAKVKKDISANPRFEESFFIDHITVVTDTLLDYLSPYIHSSISNLQSIGLKQFFHVAINITTRVVGIWSDTISSVTRVGNFLNSVTPRESGYATLVTPVVSTPVLPTGYVSQGGLTWMPITFSMNFVDANAYCTKTAINGQTGWRMAEHTELISLDISGAMKDKGWKLGDTWSSNLPYQSYLNYLYTQGVPVGSPIHVGVILGSGSGDLSWNYDSSKKPLVSCVR